MTEIKFKAGEVEWEGRYGWVCSQNHYAETAIVHNGVTQPCPACQELSELRADKERLEGQLQLLRAAGRELCTHAETTLTTRQNDFTGMRIATYNWRFVFKNSKPPFDAAKEGLSDLQK